MLNQVIIFVIKMAFLVFLIHFIAANAAGIKIDGSTVLSIIVLIFVFFSMKKWTPGLLGFIKKAVIWSAKTIVVWLYSKPERRGSANIRPPRMRWRE